MKKWLSILVALLCLTGCAPGGDPTISTPAVTTPTPTETYHDENRVMFSIDAAKGSPFNGGKFEGWGTSLCWFANRIGYSDTLAQ